MSDDSEPVLLVEDIGPVRRLTMNRPGALNALNHDLTSAISAAIREAGADDTVSVVILRGAGRAFCSGYDLNEDADEGELDARALAREPRERRTRRCSRSSTAPSP